MGVGAQGELARAFDLSGSSPKELKHVNENVRVAMSKKMPKNSVAEYVH